MKVIDLTGYYIDYVTGRRDLQSYESSYPALFDHYFKYWANRNKPIAKINETEVNDRIILIRERLKYLEKRFDSAGFDISNLKIALFVGVNRSNGHALKDGDDFIVWLPIETYFSSQLCDVFICHEIVHALHYSRREEFYFNDMTDKLTISRQLITEGITSYLTMKILNIEEGDALWADYLADEDKKRWLDQCRNEWRALDSFIFKNYKKSDSAIGIFYASNPDDIYKFRAGYYAGLKLIEQLAVADNLSLSDILEMPRHDIEKQIYDMLYKNSVN